MSGERWSHAQIRQEGLNVFGRRIRRYAVDRLANRLAQRLVGTCDGPRAKRAQAMLLLQGVDDVKVAGERSHHERRKIRVEVADKYKQVIQDEIGSLSKLNRSSPCPLDGVQVIGATLLTPYGPQECAEVADIGS